MKKNKMKKHFEEESEVSKEKSEQEKLRAMYAEFLEQNDGLFEPRNPAGPVAQ